MSLSRSFDHFTLSLDTFKTAIVGLMPISQDDLAGERDTWQNADYYEWRVSYVKASNEKEKAYLDKCGIKRVRFCIAFEVHGFMRGKLDIIYSDNVKQSLQVLGGEGAQIKEALLSIGARQESMLSDVLAQQVNWESIENIYDDETIKQYQFLHTTLCLKVCDEVKDVLASFPFTGQINLIDMGCGTAADFSINLNNRVKSQFPHVKFKVLAFDQSATSIDKCKKTSHPPEVKFIQADSTNIYSIVADEKHLAPEISVGNVKTILISSGSMTRQVLKDAFQSLAILQDVWLTSIDRFVLAGKTNILMLPRMIKRVGFVDEGYQMVAYDQEIKLGEVKAKDEVEVKGFPVHCLRKTSLENKFAAIQKKLTEKPNILDLSMSPIPVLLLEKLIKEPSLISQVKIIDLSYSKVISSEKLIKILSLYPPGIKIIYTAECLSSDVMKLIADFPLHLTLEMRASGNEYELAGSAQFLQRFNSSPKTLKTTINEIRFHQRSYDEEEARAQFNCNGLTARFNQWTLLNRHFFMLQLMMQHRSLHLRHLTSDDSWKYFSYLNHYFNGMSSVCASIDSANQLLAVLICIARLSGHTDVMQKYISYQQPLGEIDFSAISNLIISLIKNNNEYKINENGAVHNLKILLADKAINLKDICAKNPAIMFAMLASEEAVELMDLFNEHQVDFLSVRTESDHTLFTYLLKNEGVLDPAKLLAKLKEICPQLISQRIGYLKEYPLVFVAGSKDPVGVVKILMDGKNSLGLSEKTATGRMVRDELVDRSPALFDFFMQEFKLDYTAKSWHSELSYFEEMLLKTFMCGGAPFDLADYAGYFPVVIDKWILLCKMLLNSRAILLSDPRIDFGRFEKSAGGGYKFEIDKNVSLRKVLNEIVKIIFSNPEVMDKSFVSKDPEYVSFVVLLKQVAERYHCTDVIAFLEKNLANTASTPESGADIVESVRRSRCC
jgi:hypothetical protein